MDFIKLLDSIDSFVWGPPLLVLLVGTGIWLTVKLSLVQVTKLPLAMRLIFAAKNRGSGDVNSFQSLCTALAATIGTGNIVGVATAIKMGGPGALFWMWVAAFFGMATKYAEGLLAIKYRDVDANGEIIGGPMCYIEQGLGPKFKPLAIMFAIFGVLVAYFGIGTFAQVNAIVESTQNAFGVPIYITAILVTLLTAFIVIGGLQSIANFASKIVPFMALLYVVLGAGLLIVYVEKIPMAIGLVLEGAFSPTAATGGFMGATVMLAIRNGIARGVFSNESGLGSAPIAAAAAKTKWPAEQGLISMTGTFIDTIIICSITGLALIITGAWSGELKGAAMTQAAFASAFPSIGAAALTIGLILFSFTTILGWCYYGERCISYLLGVKSIKPYRWGYIFLVGIGAFLKLEAIWLLADIVNGLMAIPNLIALLGLTSVIVAETNRYFEFLARAKRLVKIKAQAILNNN